MSITATQGLGMRGEAALLPSTKRGENPDRERGAKTPRR